MNDLRESVMEAARCVYSELGPGYPETVYEEAMGVEFRHREIDYDIEKEIEVMYRGEKVGTHRLDFILEDRLVVELKAGTSLTKSHSAQLNCYMKTLKCNDGLLVNFPYPASELGPQFEAISAEY